MSSTYQPLPSSALHSSPWQGKDEAHELQPNPSRSDKSAEKHHDSPQKLRFRGLPARRRSRPKLWLGVLGKWLITVVLIVVIYVILIGYSDHEVISEKQKRYFNALITGFLIALGLTTMSQLTSSVSDLRWWILSRRARSRTKVKAILHASSMTHVLILAFKSSRLSIHLSVIAWIILSLGSQIGYASLGLCYSVEKTEGRALMVPGKVSIANLSTVETQNVIKSSSSISAQEYAANSYGTISLANEEGSIDKMPAPGTLFFADDASIFCYDNSCLYIFRETNTATLDDPDAIPVTSTTNRSVNTTTQCSSYRVVQGGNGTNANITVEINSREVEINIPSQSGPGQSTYMTTTANSCGDNCSIVSAFEASLTDPWFYNCTTRIGAVANATRDEHKLGKNLARMATSAIALQGYGAKGSIQSMTYPAAAIFGTPLNGSSEAMALLLSRFTIGVVSGAVEANTDIVVDGQAPTIGQKLSVSHWGIIHLIFGITAILQLLLAIVATVVSERVVVPEGDSLAEAQVLRAMVTDHDLDDGDLVYKGASAARGLWIYKNRDMGGGVYDLYMEQTTMST
ncbi:hypothetical protein ACJZ2D_009291 [Fusarium nematophilum]